MDVGTEKAADLGAAERVMVARPWLGPWVVTTKIRPPRVAATSTKGKKSTGIQAKAAVVALERANSAGKQASPLSSPLD